MKILLVSATVFEIQATLSELQWAPDKGAVFIGPHQLDILITGPGIHQTAWHLGQSLAVKKYDFALQAGIAGSFRQDLPIGTVVRVQNDRFGDFGSSSAQGFIPAEQLGLLPENVSRVEDHLPTFIPLSEPAVAGITVQQVNGDANSIQTVIELYAPDVETMEGASFLMACRTKQLDCFQLRSISNMVEPRNKKNWNIPLAIDRLNVRLLHILSHLP